KPSTVAFPGSGSTVRVSEAWTVSRRSTASGGLVNCVRYVPLPEKVRLLRHEGGTRTEKRNLSLRTSGYVSGRSRVKLRSISSIVGRYRSNSGASAWL